MIYKIFPPHVGNYLYRNLPEKYQTYQTSLSNRFGSVEVPWTCNLRNRCTQTYKIFFGYVFFLKLKKNSVFNFSPKEWFPLTFASWLTCIHYRAVGMTSVVLMDTKISATQMVEKSTILAVLYFVIFYCLNIVLFE